VLMRGTMICFLLSDKKPDTLGLRSMSSYKVHEHRLKLPGTGWHHVSSWVTEMFRRASEALSQSHAPVGGKTARRV
jgi:hypothetical protein